MPDCSINSLRDIASCTARIKEMYSAVAEKSATRARFWDAHAIDVQLYMTTVMETELRSPGSLAKLESANLSSN